MKILFKPKSRAVSVFLALAFSVIASGQNPESAERSFENKDYLEAIRAYAVLLKKEPDNVEYNYRLGLSYLRTNQSPDKALDYLMAAYTIGIKDDHLLFDIAKAYTYHLEYDQARQYLNRYASTGISKRQRAEFDNLMAVCNAAPELLKYPVQVEFTNPGSLINSAYPDYHPFISNNGDIMIFTSRRKAKPGTKPEFDGYFPSDIYRAEKKYGVWAEAKRLNDRINTVYDEQSVGLSTTGDTLFIYVDHVDEFGDIYTSVYNKASYGPPIALDGSVNSSAVESACSVSDDGNSMIFSSSRQGSVGGLDIWMIKKLKGNKWSDAINLGSEINTTFDEDFPTLSKDGKTLFFCSEGLPGMGGFDLFFSNWDEQSQMWTKPQNLGYPINSPADEKNISFQSDGRHAAMTSLRKDGYGDLDVYEVFYTNADSITPAVFLIKIPMPEGSLTPEIEIRNVFDEKVGRYTANALTGTHTVALYPGKYFLYVDAKGYKPYTEGLVVSDFHKRQDQNVRVINLKK